MLLANGVAADGRDGDRVPIALDAMHRGRLPS